MEQKFGINSLDLQMLREFCEHEGEVVSYQKGERMECTIVLSFVATIAKCVP